jgi:hypothetical protein
VQPFSADFLRSLGGLLAKLGSLRFHQGKLFVQTGVL